MHSTVVFFCWKQCFFIDVIKPVKTLSYNKKRKIHRCEATTTNATTTKKCNQSELVHTLPTNRHITNQISLVTELREVPRSKTDFKAREIKPTLKNNTNEHQKLFLNKLKKKISLRLPICISFFYQFFIIRTLPESSSRSIR